MEAFIRIGVVVAARAGGHGARTFQREVGTVFDAGRGGQYPNRAAHDAGAIDKILWAQVAFIKSEAAPQRPETGRPVSERDKIANWGAWQDLSGDLIVENNIHLIDVMNWFVGTRPIKAHGAGGAPERAMATLATMCR